MRKRVLTYGTFDLLHVGHIRLLNRLSALGDELIVGVSTDEFNASKGKKAIYTFEDRLEIVSSLASVTRVIAENSWEQKVKDIEELSIDTFAMGSDWQGKFDHLRQYCNVIYLQRTDNISTSEVKSKINNISDRDIYSLHQSIELLSALKKSLA